MEEHASERHDFWDDISEQLCDTLIKEPVSYDPDCLERILAQTERDALPIAYEPSLEQAAEDREYTSQIDSTRLDLPKTRPQI